MAKSPTGPIRETIKKIPHDRPVDWGTVAYVAMSIQQVSKNEFIIIELEMDDKDNILKVVKTDPMPFYVAVHTQKKRAAFLFTRQDLH